MERVPPTATSVARASIFLRANSQPRAWDRGIYLEKSIDWGMLTCISFWAKSMIPRRLICSVPITIGRSRALIHRYKACIRKKFRRIRVHWHSRRRFIYHLVWEGLKMRPLHRPGFQYFPKSKSHLNHSTALMLRKNQKSTPKKKKFIRSSKISGIVLNHQSVRHLTCRKTW